MKIYLAPMEGITGYIYRNNYQACFGNIDTYFSPFIFASTRRSLRSRELKDILPENNENLHLVPQILSNDAKAFLHTCEEMKHFGYKEVNFNLGCPAKTVVSKGRGSGFLANEKKLDQFFDEIFSKADIEISVKTRLGKDFPSEFHDLIKIYNKYPIKELIIHPRTQQDFYNNKPHMDMFQEAVDNCIHKLCYNGDIFSKRDYDNFIRNFPQVDTIMLGRGIIGNPGLVDELHGRDKITKEKLKEFHDCLYEDYQRVIDGERNVLYKMKEIWCYLAPIFQGNKKAEKKIKKAQKLSQYEEGVREIFRLPMFKV